MTGILADTLTALSDLGGLAGLAAVLTALGTLRRAEHHHAQRRADDNARWQTVTAELRPNHGSSLRDAVSRIEHAQQVQGEYLASLRQQVASIGQRVDDIAHTMDRDHADYGARIRALEHER